MVKRFFTVCLLLLFVLPSFVSCSATGESPVSLVPESANMVVQIKMAQILSNPALIETYDELAKTKPSWPPTANEAFGQFTQKTGIDPYSISTLVFFADMEAADMKQASYSGIIVSGSFDSSSLLEKIQKETQEELTSSDYKGFTVYSDSQNKGEFVFLEQDRIAFGTPQAVRDIVDVFKGDQNSLSGKVIDALTSLGTAQITGAFETSANISDHFGESTISEFQLPLGNLQEIELIAFSTDFQVLTLTSRIDAYFPSPDSVQDAEDAVTGAISIARSMTEDENIKTVLNRVRVTTSGSVLTIRGELNLTEVINMGDGMALPE